jgi:CBS domain-containing protein
MPTIEKHIVRDVIALDASTSCTDAAHLMEARRIGSVGVRKDGKLVGLVTERDLVYGVMAKGGDGRKTLAEVMRADRPTVSPTSTERDCAHLMQSQGTRHLLVKKEGEIVGVVSMLDVLSLMLEDNRFLIEQLHTYIRGGRGGLRDVLYMAALVAKRHNPLIAGFAKRLAGKPPKVIIIACARKLLVILNAMRRNGTDWRAEVE